ncbi:hypothetical protein SRHO_G00279560 [Serrasalmus rhombeus]
MSERVSAKRRLTGPVRSKVEVEGLLEVTGCDVETLRLSEPSVNHLLIKTDPSYALTCGPLQTENYGSVSRPEIKPGLHHILQRRNAVQKRLVR